MQVKVTNQHEWMRLALTESKDKKLSLIWSHRGDRASGVGIGKKLLNQAIHKWYAIRSNCKTTLGDAMAQTAKIADRCQTIEQFVAQMQ